MLEYFSLWQYLLLAIGFVYLMCSAYLIRKEQNLVYALILLFIGSACIHWFSICIDPFLNTWDEQYHALVARNCMAHPLKPTFYDKPFYPVYYKTWIANHVWLHKQPLFLWQMALSMKIFGISEITLRIPGFVMMTIASLLIFRIGQLAVSAKTGIYAGAIFSTLYYVMKLSSGSVPTDHNDVAFLFYMTASIWAWTEYVSSNHKRWIYVIAILVGCAVLNKWLTGLLVYGVWGITLLVFPVRPFSIKSFRPLLLSFFVCVLVFLPWQIFIALKFPLESSWERSYNTLHLFEAVEGHSGNDFYHLDMISILYNLFVPFIILPGFIFLKRDSKNSKITGGLIIAAIVTYIFFTIAKTKMTAFTFPLAGIFCIALAALFSRIETSLVSKSKKLYALFFALFVFFCYFNLDVNTIQREHGISKSNPLKNPYSTHRRREAMFFKELSNTMDMKNDPVIFNVPMDDRAMMMFYTGATCYDNFPSHDDVAKLKSLGRPVFVIDDEKIPQTLESDSTINKIRYPENTIVNQRKAAFRFSNNKFLCYEQEGKNELHVNRDIPGPWETFTLISFADKSFAILAPDNKFLSVWLNGDQRILFGPTKAQEWEHFYFEQLENGKMAMKDCNNNFVTLTKDLTLMGGNHDGKNATMEIIYMSD